MLRYQPDADPNTPDVILDGDNFVPTNSGGIRQGFASSMASPGLAGQLVRGAYLAVLPGSTYRIFTGHATQLRESGVNVSRSGSAYSATQWKFEQFIKTTIATVSLGTLDYPQASETSGSFANMGGAPKARIAVAQDNALYLFNVERGGVAYPDGWHRSDTGNISNWVPESDGGTGESAFGQFTETPGPITAACKQGGEIIVFKNRGMWRGRYVGFPDIVAWELITPSVGCVGPNAVINVEDVLYFVSGTDVWRFDGSRPVSITEGLRTKVAALLRANYSTLNQLFIGHDDELNVLYFFYTFPAGRGLAYLAHNYKTQAWGPAAENGSPDVSDNGGGIDPSSFFNAPSELARAAINDPSGKSSCPCFGIDSLGTWVGSLKQFNSGTSMPGGTTLTWTMHWIAQTAKQGGNMVAIYPIFNVGKVLASTDAMTVAVSAFRNRAGGPTQQTQTGTFSSTLGKVDVSASGTMFKTVYTVTPQNASSVGFEFLGHELEFSDTARPKN